MAERVFLKEDGTMTWGSMLHLRLHKESGGIEPCDQGGSIPSRREMLEIFERLEKYYATHSDEDIAADNALLDNR